MGSSVLLRGSVWGSTAAPAAPCPSLGSLPAFLEGTSRPWVLLCATWLCCCVRLCWSRLSPVVPISSVTEPEGPRGTSGAAPVPPPRQLHTKHPFWWLRVPQKGDPTALCSVPGPCPLPAQRFFLTAGRSSPAASCARCPCPGTGHQAEPGPIPARRPSALLRSPQPSLLHTHSPGALSPPRQQLLQAPAAPACPELGAPHWAQCSRRGLPTAEQRGRAAPCPAATLCLQPREPRASWATSDAALLAAGRAVCSLQVL